MREIRGMWMDGSSVAGKEWSKSSGGWSGEYRYSWCGGVYHWGVDRVVDFSERVCEA